MAATKISVGMRFGKAALNYRMTVGLWNIPSVFCHSFWEKRNTGLGLNIVRRRQKRPTVVLAANRSECKRLSFPYRAWAYQTSIRTSAVSYFSTYLNHDGAAPSGVKKNTSSVNGGMDLKYGSTRPLHWIWTLIPDFGQVQSDNRILNLSPFELKYSENRPFFTEGKNSLIKGTCFTKPQDRR